MLINKYANRYGSAPPRAQSAPVEVQSAPVQDKSAPVLAVENYNNLRNS